MSYFNRINVLQIIVIIINMRKMWIKNTNGIHSRNLMDSKPPEYLLPKRLPNINQYIAVITIATEIINQKGCIAPVNPHY